MSTRLGLGCLVLESSACAVQPSYFKITAFVCNPDWPSSPTSATTPPTHHRSGSGLSSQCLLVCSFPLMKQKIPSKPSVAATGPMVYYPFDTGLWCACLFCCESQLCMTAGCMPTCFATVRLYDLCFRVLVFLLPNWSDNYRSGEHPLPEYCPHLSSAQNLFSSTGQQQPKWCRVHCLHVSLLRRPCSEGLSSKMCHFLLLCSFPALPWHVHTDLARGLPAVNTECLEFDLRSIETDEEDPIQGVRAGSTPLWNDCE